LHVGAHAVAAPALPEVVDGTLFGQRPIIGQVERPDLAVAAFFRMTVDDVQRLAVRRDGDAVGAVDLLLRQFPRDFPRIYAIDGFDVHLHVAAVGTVARVGEPDPPLAVHATIVGAVVALAVVLVGQHRHLAGLHVGAHDAASARTLLAAFTTDE